MLRLPSIDHSEPYLQFLILNACQFTSVCVTYVYACGTMELMHCPGHGAAGDV